MFIKNSNSLSEPAIFFKKNHWVKIEKMVDKYLVNFLYQYVKQEDQRLKKIDHLIDKKHPFYDSTVFGEYNDPQARGDFSKYGDLAFDTILVEIKHLIEIFTGLDLVPTYSYHRLYTNGTELRKHKDRPSCAVSVTMNIGSDLTNIKKYNWPMYIKNKQNQELPIYLHPGDIIIYRGCELEHWREPFKGVNQAQAFFHFVEKEKNSNMLFDGRPALGLPVSFRDETKIKK